MKYLFLSLFLCSCMSQLHAQDRVLKNPQPGLIELTQFQIKIQPGDTMFNNVDFSYLPVKGFPLFTASPNQPFYTVEQRDSIIRLVDSFFFEE